MKYVYPVVFTEEDNNFLASVPDLPGCHTFGETLCEAIEMARDAMTGWLSVSIDYGDEIPEPTDINKTNLKKNQKSFLIETEI